MPKAKLLKGDKPGRALVQQDKAADEAHMADYLKETDARIAIDELLRQSGWDPADKSQVLTEVTIKDGTGHVDESQAKLQRRATTRTRDGDEIPTGRADYVLFSQNGRPLAVIEAKRAAFHP